MHVYKLRNPLLSISIEAKYSRDIELGFVIKPRFIYAYSCYGVYLWEPCVHTGAILYVRMTVCNGLISPGETTRGAFVPEGAAVVTVWVERTVPNCMG